MSLIKLFNRVIDDDGNVIYYHQGLIDYLYKHKSFPENILFFPDKDIDQYNKFTEYYNGTNFLKLPIQLKTHNERKNNWFYPTEYNNINLEEFFLNKCYTEIEKNRVLLELKEYKKSNMEKLLRFSIYLMDYINQHNYVIGVGRGSSVCSYCLYLIGLHQIDSIYYDLNIKDFLKD